MEDEVEEYILVHFKEKIDQSFFTEKNIFFKMVNINTKKPHVQIGHHIFNGKYEDALGFGTNLFFEEQEFSRQTSIYEQQTPIHLKHIASTSKILSLRWQKVPDEIVDIDTKDLIELEFKENYETVLNKVETGTLDIKEAIKVQKVKQVNIPTIEENNILESERIENEPEIFNDHLKSATINNDTATAVPEIDIAIHSDHENRYNLLKKIVMKPVIQPEYLNTHISVHNFTNESELSILKELYLKNLDYKNISLEVDEKNIENFVDIESSINDGIVLEKDIRTLSESDKQSLISLNNFDNLSLPMKVCLLIEHLKDEKQSLSKLESNELSEKDQFGRTPKDRYRLLKTIAKDLHYYLFLRLRENKLNAKVSEE